MCSRVLSRTEAMTEIIDWRLPSLGIGVMVPGATSEGFDSIQNVIRWFGFPCSKSLFLYRNSRLSGKGGAPGMLRPFKGSLFPSVTEDSHDKFFEGRRSFDRRLP